MTSTLSESVRAQKAKDPLTPLVNQWLLERPGAPKPFIPKHDTYRPPGRFSPSGLKCLRADVFKFMGVKPQRKVTPRQQLIFDVGDWLHWMWFSNFRAMERFFSPAVFKVVAIETSVALPQLYMAGRFDVHVEINGVAYIIDVKTSNDRGFKFRKRNRSPERQHKRQLIRYLRSRGVSRGLIFYFNKDTQDFMVFRVRYTKDEWLPTRKWLKLGMRYLHAGKVPPRHEDCSRGSRMANDCPFSYICYPKRSAAELRKITYGGKPTPQELWEANNA